MVQSILDGQSFPVRETTSPHVSSCHQPAFLPHLCPRSPLVLLQQLADELLGELAGVTEELLIKLVVYGGNVLQGVVFGLPQEGRSAAQPGTRQTGQHGGDTNVLKACRYWKPLRENRICCVCIWIPGECGKPSTVYWAHFWSRLSVKMTEPALFAVAARISMVWGDLQDVGDDPDAPHVRLQAKRFIVDDLRRFKEKPEETVTSAPSRVHRRLNRINSPTNSGVPKMFLNSTPASISWAKPKSMSLILGSGTFLSSIMMFSGCRRRCLLRNSSVMITSNNNL